MQNNDTSTLAPRHSVDFLTPFKILLNVQVALVLIAGGLQYASWTMSLTSLSTKLEAAPYNYSVAHVGLMYLPQGILCLTGSMISGKSLNMYYKYCRLRYDAKRAEDENIPPFNKVRVRLDCSIIPMVLTLVGLLLFGWEFERTTNVAAVVVGTCLISFGTSCVIAIVTTMVVDLYPGHGSASTSSINLVRCCLAAAGVAALDRMVKSLGIGGCYTLMAGLCFASDLSLFYVVYRYLKHLKERVEKGD